MNFEYLDLWLDPVRRSGPEAMAVDEWLWENSSQPILRVYAWDGAWGSLGYFGKLAEARADFPDIRYWVRRWSGGGTVDHRADWTYTIVVPQGHPVSAMKGAESYHVIHAALAQVLADEGIEARLSGACDKSGTSACFENPVCYDLVDASGKKIAGAGQRRNRHGLLHQGSLALPTEALASASRAEKLAMDLATTWSHWTGEPLAQIIENKVAERYGRNEWTERC